MNDFASFLTDAALKDEMTGLYNKRFFEFIIDKYKNNKITLKSLSMCETDLKIIKYKDKYYMSGNLNIYTDYSFYELFGNRSQVFNKKTIGIITDFERFVYGLKTKGDELNIGLNEKESYGGIKVYIIPASKKNSTNPMN